MIAFFGAEFTKVIPCTAGGDRAEAPRRAADPRDRAAEGIPKPRAGR
jgi:hypothetical protein